MKRPENHYHQTLQEGIPLRLGFRPPLNWGALTEFLVSRSDGLSQGVVGDQYVRTVQVGSTTGWLAARPVADNLLQIELSPSLESVRCFPSLARPGSGWLNRHTGGIP
ncbi:AlkA N-terminal domain-containing protein [Marinobacter sp.]|uniref:AlkA N-terminal domain-containing protein n=1 Tax=Marinobacter sp. TaxID=50741 RepID=UPI003564A120